jgi:hypothetical protein
MTLNKTEASDNVSSLIRYATRSKFECKPVLTTLLGHNVQVIVQVTQTNADFKGVEFDSFTLHFSNEQKYILVMYDISLIKPVLWC